MYIIYILWLVVAANILHPSKPSDSEKLPVPAARFWHGATWIEAFGVMWVYLITYIPVFLSEKAIKLRDSIARSDHTRLLDLEAQNELTSPAQEYVRCRDQRRLSRSSRKSCLMSLYRRLHPYTRLRSKLTDFVVWYSEMYFRANGIKRGLLWLGAEILMPWHTTPVLLAGLWLFGIGVLSLDIEENAGIVASRWDLGQLLPPFMILLPFATLIGSIAGKQIKHLIQILQLR